MSDPRPQNQETARQPGTAESTQAAPGPTESQRPQDASERRAAPGETSQAPETVADVAALQKELEASRKRVNELAYALQESHRDREEFKQRIQRERERLMDVERGNVATALLETVDELELCLRAANPADPLAQGVKMIRDGILTRLVQSGVERIDVNGKTFNPNEHEAADMEVVANPEDDQKIVAEVRAGYRMKDRVVRPARVKVAKFIQPAQA